MSSNEFNILRIQALEKRVKELEEELKLQDQKRESLEWHYKLESDELKAELKQDNIELKNANKLAHERINKLEEHNTLLKERFEKDESSYLDATKAAFKRYIDAEGIRPNERFSKVVKQLQMYLPTDNESIEDKKIILEQSKRINELKELNEELKSGETILKYQDTLGEQQARIKELERNIEQLEMELQ